MALGAGRVLEVFSRPGRPPLYGSRRGDAHPAHLADVTYILTHARSFSVCLRMCEFVCVCVRLCVSVRLSMCVRVPLHARVHMCACAPTHHQMRAECTQGGRTSIPATSTYADTSKLYMGSRATAGAARIIHTKIRCDSSIIQ